MVKMFKIWKMSCIVRWIDVIFTRIITFSKKFSYSGIYFVFTKLANKKNQENNFLISNQPLKTKKLWKYFPVTKQMPEKQESFHVNIFCETNKALTWLRQVKQVLPC